MLTVPPPPRFRMTNAPLLQAVAQVNFPIVARLGSVEGIAPLQDALADVFPYMTQQVVHEVSLMIGPAGPAAPESAQSTMHQFTDDDGWELSVTVSSASLSVAGSEYAGVHDFAERFRSVCVALYEAGRVRRCDRLGVRYLDVVELVNGRDDWALWFRPEIVGLAHPALSRESLTSSVTETRLQQAPSGALAPLSNPVMGVIRHGVLPPGSLMQGVPPQPVKNRAFVFDMDTYVESPQSFEPQKLADQYMELHNAIESAFHWSVTEAGRIQFGYELVADGEG